VYEAVFCSRSNNRLKRVTGNACGKERPMSENLWDAYGKWNDIAGLGNVDDVKRLISGNRMWRSNYVSPPLQYIFNYIVEEAKEAGESAPVCLDFGCGLGRNAPMLRHFFPGLLASIFPKWARG
jgi:hypothetical protein